ncbi:MAG: diguanylate cyclase [Pseudomonadota bacterium]
MSGRILIIDSVATNRIILKVKLLSAQYEVTAVADLLQAEAQLSQNRPDLIVINLGDQSEDRHGFCKGLRNSFDTGDIALLGVGTADTAKARLAALDVGVTDLLPHPINEDLLLARVRSLLRQKNVYSEIWVRDAAGRALGFEETNVPYSPPVSVHVLTSRTTMHPAYVKAIRRVYAPNMQILPLDRHVPLNEQGSAPDLYVIDATTLTDPHESLFRLTADLRSRRHTRLAMQLVVVSPNAKDVAAIALDLGADDVVRADASEEEISLRCKLLQDQKRKSDRFHSQIKDGLMAAVKDPLTGLYNRRYADPYLKALTEKSQQSRQDFAVMMIDIDHFKKVNDTYGHAAGDAILVDVAQRLRENLREIDLIARIGGEEFLVALPQTTRDMAELTADRLRMVVNETPFTVAHIDAPLAISVSIGVAVGGVDDEEAQLPSTDDMCLLADSALYAAKSAGRNQVSFAA